MTASRRSFTLGPGLVFFLSMTGPGAIVSSAAAGAAYGYSLIWVIALTLAFRFVWVDASARYVLVTGESLLQGYARLGRWLVWITLAAAVVIRHSTNLYIVLLMGQVIQSLLPLPLANAAVVYSLFFVALGFAMMFWGGYVAIERACGVLCVVLGGSMLAAALLSHPAPGAILRGTLLPSIPRTQGLYSVALLLASMVGAEAGTMSNLTYSYFVQEKGWKGASFLGRQKWDLLSGLAAKFFMGALVLIAAAGTLRPLGIQPRNAEHIITIFTQTQGQLGRVIFCAGFWAVSFSTFVGGTIGYSLLIRDIGRRLLPSPDAAPVVKEAARRDPLYRYSVAFLALSPLYILFTRIEPVALALTVRALVVMVIPIFAAALLKLTSDRSLMGAHRNRWSINAIMILLILISLYLGCRSGWEAWQKLVSA